MKTRKVFLTVSLLIAILVLTAAIYPWPKNIGEASTSSRGPVHKIRAATVSQVVIPQKAVVNVKRDFKAVGNGKADDTSAIQNAINHAGNKVVYFPPGTYMVGSLRLRSNTIMESYNHSMQYSKVTMPVVLRAKSKSAEILVLNGASNCIIDGIAFDGNGQSCGIVQGGNNLNVRNCKFYNCKTGIGDSNIGDNKKVFSELTVDGCMFSTCGTGLSDFSSSAVENSFFYVCRNGILINRSNNLIYDNKIEQNTQNGIYALNGNHCNVRNNIFDANGYNAIRISKGITDCTLDGNIMRRNGRIGETDDQKAHINIDGASNLTFNGNITVCEHSYDDGTGLLVPDYAVYCVNSKNVTFNGNDLSGEVKKPVFEKNNIGLKMNN